MKDFDPEKALPKKLGLPQGELFYCGGWYGVRVFKAPEKKKRELTKEELARKEKEKKIKEIKAAIKTMNTDRKEFIANLISGHLKRENYMIDALWGALMSTGAHLWPSGFRKFFTGKSDYDCSSEEKKEAQEKVDSLDTMKQMLVAMHKSMENIGDIYNWQGKYKEEIGRKLIECYEILEAYGWSFSSEEHEKILDGSSDLFNKEE